jgi:ribosomal protein S11
MILSKIIKQKNRFKVLNLKIYIEKLIKISNFFNNIKISKKIKLIFLLLNVNKLNKKFKKPVSFKNTQNLINYIININLSKTNTIVNVTDINGNPKVILSAGLIKLKSSQKIVQPFAIINILKSLFLKATFLNNKCVALHFKNTKIYYESLIINILKNKVFIKSIRSYNLYPHNGCRPKKLKRFKKRTKQK